MSNAEDQQFCLRWNNFQANITSQFETLRDDEDFVDVTLACEGQRLEAHKVVLSACSPFFKELFKSNPCPHPIIFMRDVEARHIIALLEFMYAGEVNVSQAHLSGFLRTAESLQIRGLTDASKAHKIQPKSTDGQEQSMCNVQQSQSNRSLVNKSNLCTTSTKSLSPQPNIKSLKSEHSTTKQHLNVSSIETTVTDEKSQKSNKNPSPSSSPTPAKRQCKETITENILSENNRLDDKTESEDVPQKSSGNMNINPFATLHQTQFRDVHSELDLEADIVEPKVELPDYASDEEMRAESRMTESILGLDGPDTDQLSNIRGGMDILSGSSSLNIAEMSQESLQGGTRRSPRRGLRRSSMGNFSNGDGASSSWVTLPITALDMSRSSCATNGENQQGSASASDMLSRFAEWTSTSHEIGIGSSLSDQQLELLSNHRRDNCHHRGRSSGRIVKLGEGIEVCEEQLRGVKWNDYRKLTRGLATILFSPLELATCSVTGQRWSRAGTGQRPVKPALDSAKVQAIISYVATRFPMVEISRIKQVLAYKCKENSTAFKMKAIRYFGDQQPPDNQQKAL